MWRHLKYALTLCLVEPLIALVIAALWHARVPTPSEAGFLLLIFAAVTGLRIVINVPVNAACIAALARSAQGKFSRLWIPIVNAVVYAGLGAGLALLGGDTDSVDDLPAIYFWFAIACVLSPLIPWIRLPLDEDGPQHASPEVGNA